MAQFRYIGFKQKPRSFPMQVLGFVVGLVVLGVSLVLGAFVLAALLSFMLILAVVIGIRLWWVKRQINGPAANDEYIDAEYRVVHGSDNGTDRHKTDL